MVSPWVYSQTSRSSLNHLLLVITFQSTLQPNTIDKSPAKEVARSFMIALFTSPPLAIHSISPISIAARKYTSKNTLFIDLSSPHGTTTPSMNSLISSLDFSMHNASIRHAINLICLSSYSACVAKVNITSDLKVFACSSTFLGCSLEFLGKVITILLSHFWMHKLRAANSLISALHIYLPSLWHKWAVFIAL